MENVKKRVTFLTSAALVCMLVLSVFSTVDMPVRAEAAAETVRADAELGF